MPDPQHVHFVQSIEPLQGGGLGTAVVQLHAQLLALGHASRVLTTVGRKESVGRGQMTEDRGQTETEGVRQFARVGPTKAFYAPGLSAAAAECLASAGAVVHGHGFYVYPNAVLGRLSRRMGRPLVYHPHGMFEPWILARSPVKKRVAHWLFENANFRHARLWRALTPKEADQIRAQGIAAPVVVIPNGIDPGAWQFPDRSARTGNRRQILFLGRLHPKKGLALLVAAWARLAPQHPDWEVVIAGPDENGHRATIETQVREAGLGGSVRFTGPVTGEERRMRFQEAEIFILPSHSEGFPMAVLEACGAALPVVATTACNFPEVTSAEAGWECEPTADSLAAALGSALAADDRERRQRGANGRKLVETKYAWPTLAATLHAECLKLL